MRMDHLVPGLDRHLLDFVGGLHANPGVVDQNINPPKSLRDVINKALDRGFIGGVAREALGVNSVRTKCRDCVSPGHAIQIVDRDACALGSKRAGVGIADTPCTPGNDCDLSL